MYEGKHIHYSPVDNRPLCSYSGKLCRQRRVNGYAFCIRHILEDKTAPFKQCAHVAKYNNQKCTNPIPSNEDREFCNSHMQVAGMAPKKERKNKKEKEGGVVNMNDGKLKFSDRVKVLLKSEGDASPENFDPVDDPYTFSDAVLELPDGKRLSCEAAVAKSPDATAPEPVVEPLVKLESAKSNCVLDKSKGNAVRSSKTVNRLEAKIAQNRILDKLKRSRPSGAGTPCTRLGFDVAASVDHCPSEIDCSANISQCMEPASVQSSCTNNNVLPASGRTRTDCHHSSVLCSKPMECDFLNSRNVPTYNIMPNKQTKAWTWRKPELVSNAVNQLQRICEDKKDLVANIFPLGFEGTDSENEDSNQETYQKHWFASPGDQESWPDDQHGVLLRPIKLNLGKAELRRHCIQLRRAQIALLPSRRADCSLAQALVTACRKQPLRTTRLLGTLRSDCCQQGAKKRMKKLSQNRQKCCYSNEEVECSKTALPYTRHCIKHIMYNVDQLLFEHCTAKFADNTQCCIPVFDICHELPLCVEHARKRDNYSKMSAEPKPKKPRKKTKPSALTRPPKRGKKKRRQANIRLPELNTPSQSSTSQELPPSLHFDMSSSGLSPQTSPLDTDDVTNELGSPMESGLGSELDGPLSPGTIDKSLGLPIDAAELANQASRLLEEHDFTEVLNKIPDEAFRELFNESKNGDLSPSKEETEELERALAAVDKDVKSLQKFSSTGQLDIHDSLLQNDHLGATIDTLSELAGSGIGMDSLHVITSSLTTSDLNSISQVLSSITSEGSLAHLPILSDIVNSSGHHSADLVAGGFAVGSHPLLAGRNDLGNIDQYVCDPVDTSASHAYWLNEQLSIPVCHNGLLSPHNYGHLPSSKFVPHSLANLSKLESKGRNHLNNLSASLLENSLNLSTMAPMVMELTENSTESVS